MDHTNLLTRAVASVRTSLRVKWLIEFASCLILVDAGCTAVGLRRILLSTTIPNLWQGWEVSVPTASVHKQLAEPLGSVESSMDDLLMVDCEG